MLKGNKMVKGNKKKSSSTVVLDPVNTVTDVSETSVELKETVVVSESFEKVELITEETKTEEKLNENAIVEEDDQNISGEENAIVKEEDQNVLGEEDDEEDPDEEEDKESDEEEVENNDENQTAEAIIKEKKEDNNNHDNAIQKVGKEKKEEDNNDDSAIQEEVAKEKENDNAIEEEKSNEKKDEVEKEDSKVEPVSENPVKNLKKRKFKKKKVANKDQNRPETSVKQSPAKKAKTLSAAKDGEEEGPAAAAKKAPVTKDETESKKGKDKPETSGKNKTSPKKVESMGMIFMCSSKTKQDCYHYNVLGLPARKKETVLKIYKGMRLFLYDIDLKLMYGIYKASAPGGYNIEPKAFNSAYPSQVRFTVMEDCEPLGEEKFKKVIKDNYYAKNKFNPQLNSEQVKNLCKLFVVAKKEKTPKSKKPARSLKSAPVEPRQPAGRGGKIRRRPQDEPKRPPRSPRRPARRNADRRPVDRRLIDYRPVDRQPVDYRPVDRHAVDYRPVDRYEDRHVVYEREAFVQPLPPVVPLSYSYDLPPLENRGRSYMDYDRDRYYYREREPMPFAREYGYPPAPAAAEYNYLPAPALPPPRYSYPDPAVSEYRSTVGGRAEYRTPADEGRHTDYLSSARNRVYRL